MTRSTNVRAHRRTTRKGKPVNVRAHNRNTRQSTPIWRGRPEPIQRDPDGWYRTSAFLRPKEGGELYLRTFRTDTRPTKTMIARMAKGEGAILVD